MKVSIFLILFTLSPKLLPQTVMDRLSQDDPIQADEISLIPERIEKVSPSKRIFIITNENESFQVGDFISLLVDKKLASRALVAKRKDKVAGIKIVKIYNLALWKKLGPKTEIQIIKGDDSSYQKKDRPPQQMAPPQEDLFEKTVISDDITEKDPKGSVIISNHQISVLLGWFEAINSFGESTRYSQLNFQYMYQAWKNIFLEIGFGSNVVKDFPSKGLDTRYYNITPKGKYTFEILWGLVLQPYLGWQFLIADSPGAGQTDSETNREQLAQELKLVEDSEQSRAIFGITLQQAIIPGWNLKADLGMDIISIGVGLEI
jgi:hypothetical protein